MNPITNRRQNGSATILYIILLALMMLLVTTEGANLFRLRREIKLLDAQQIKRLAASQTNIVALTHPASK